jgi:hypothetical protein
VEDGDSDKEGESLEEGLLDPDPVRVWERLSVAEGVIEKVGVDVGDALVDG